MRLIVALAMLLLTSCASVEPEQSPRRDVSTLPVYPIDEPFRIVEEVALLEPIPLVFEALLRVWEVDGGAGWITLDAVARHPLSSDQAKAVFSDLFAIGRDAADSRGLPSVFVDVCWLDADAYEICGNAEYAKTAASGWARKQVP